MLFIFFTLALSADAQNLDSRYANQLMHAKNSSQVTNINRHYDQTRIARLACKLQLRQGEAPIKCFEALSLESRWGVSSLQSRVKAFEHLENLCLRAADRLHVPEKLRLGPEISKNCRLRVLEAQKLREYRRADSVSSEMESVENHVD